MCIYLYYWLYVLCGQDVLCVAAEGHECGTQVGWKICDFDATAAPARHFQWHCLTPKQAETLCGSVFPAATAAPTCPSYMFDCGDTASASENVTQRCIYQVGDPRTDDNVI